MLVLFTKFENVKKNNKRNKKKKISFQKKHPEVHLTKQKVFRGLQFLSPAKTNYLVER